jgi:hypothetical protein
MLRVWDVSQADCDAEDGRMRSACYDLIGIGAQGHDALANTRVIVCTSVEVFMDVLAGVRRNFKLTVANTNALARLNANLHDAEIRCRSASKTDIGAVKDGDVELGARDAHGIQIDTHNALWSHQHWDELWLKQDTTNERVRVTVVGVAVYPLLRYCADFGCFSVYRCYSMST